MSTPGAIMISLGDIMSTPGGYLNKCRGRSLGKQLNLYGNSSVLNTPCTHDTLTLIMVCPQCTHGMSPVYSWYPPVY